ncbi:hypothetical protein [Antribacter gilvus]|uniref:hypothetical protein n=1 Tax=Antribacter gilvus TaxID=2304675 RepID=UPI000F77D24F|nr:hypothetical protein [Antribacter gilvus]
MSQRVIDTEGVEWLTYAQASARFRLPQATIRSWVHRGVIHPEDVKRWKGRVTGVAASAVARAEVHLYRNGAKLAAGHRRGAPKARRSDVQQ